MSMFSGQFLICRLLSVSISVRALHYESNFRIMGRKAGSMLLLLMVNRFNIFWLILTPNPFSHMLLVHLSPAAFNCNIGKLESSMCTGRVIMADGQDYMIIPFQTATSLHTCDIGIICTDSAAKWHFLFA